MGTLQFFEDIVHICSYLSALYVSVHGEVSPPFFDMILFAYAFLLSFKSLALETTTCCFFFQQNCVVFLQLDLVVAVHLVFGAFYLNLLARVFFGCLALLVFCMWFTGVSVVFARLCLFSAVSVLLFLLIACMLLHHDSALLVSYGFSALSTNLLTVMTPCVINLWCLCFCCILACCRIPMSLLPLKLAIFAISCFDCFETSFSWWLHLVFWCCWSVASCGEFLQSAAIFCLLAVIAWVCCWRCCRSSWLWFSWRWVDSEGWKWGDEKREKEGVRKRRVKFNKAELVDVMVSKACHSANSPPVSFTHPWPRLVMYNPCSLQKTLGIRGISALRMLSKKRKCSSR